jgi:hypothetical protein
MFTLNNNNSLLFLNKFLRVWIPKGRAKESRPLGYAWKRTCLPLRKGDAQLTQSWAGILLKYWCVIARHFLPGFFIFIKSCSTKKYPLHKQRVGKKVGIGYRNKQFDLSDNVILMTFLM